MTSDPHSPPAAAGAVGAVENVPSSHTDDVVSELSPAFNKILVIGGPSVGKRFILQRLSRSPTPLSLSPSSLPTSPSSSIPLRTFHHPIDTRYYTASLHFHVLNDADVPPFTPSSLASLLSSPLLSELQGVMLVYDAAERGSLESVQRWGGVLERVNDEDSVLLMVGVERERGRGSDAVWAAARDWAIDHSVEHVRLRFDDESAPAHSEEGGDEDDEEGVRRIAGAFEANQWQHMVLKDRASAARQRLTRTEDDSGDGDGGADGHPLSINARLAHEEEREEAELEAHVQAEADEEAKVEEERARLRHQLELAGARLNDEDDGDDIAKSDAERAREDEQMEAHLTSFEAMFERMQAVRQEAVRAHAAGPAPAAPGSAPLSDIERRRRAEEAILSMLNSLGMEDGEDDDSDER